MTFFRSHTNFIFLYLFCNFNFIILKFTVLKKPVKYERLVLHLHEMFRYFSLQQNLYLSELVSGSKKTSNKKLKKG